MKSTQQPSSAEPETAAEAPVKAAEAPVREGESLPTLGRYGLVSEIGRGTMGVVFRALDPLIGRTVALKAFQISFPISADEVEVFRKRFLLEGQIIGQLKHPNIVVVHDVGVGGVDSVPYIAMELVEGTNLEDEIVRGRPPSLDRALELTGQVAGALSYAHELGVVHRDIKPANVLITTEGVPKIVDFGVARISRVKLTGEAKVFGSPAYMSPEQIVGEEVDGRSDLFSLGILLYILVTGEHPFPGDDLASVAYKVLYQDPPLPSERRRSGEVGNLDAVVMKALAKKREDRYQTGAEMQREATALRAELSGQPLVLPATSSAPIPPVADAAVPPRRWRAIALGITVVVSWTLAGAAGVELLLARALEKGPDPPPALQSPPDAGPLLSISSHEPPRPVADPAALLAELLSREGKPVEEPSPVVLEPLEKLEKSEKPEKPERPKPAPKPQSHAPAPASTAVEPPVLENIASGATAHIPVGILAPSILTVDFDHHLSTGTLQGFVDGQKVVEAPLAAKLKKTLGILAKHNERLRSSVSIAPGLRQITVRVSSPELKIYESGQITVNLPQGIARTLKIRYGRMFGGLSLELQN